MRSLTADDFKLASEGIRNGSNRHAGELCGKMCAQCLAAASSGLDLHRRCFTVLSLSDCTKTQIFVFGSVIDGGRNALLNELKIKVTHPEFDQIIKQEQFADFPVKAKIEEEPKC